MFSGIWHIHHIGFNIYHNCITNAFETTTIRDKSMSLTRNALRGMYTCYDFFNYYKKHLDASVKERPQTLLVPSEENL